MKKLNFLLVALLIAVFAIFAMGSGESTPATTNNQGSGTAANAEQTDNNEQIGDYTLVIDSCRLAKSFDDKPVVIVKYIFSNVGDDNASAFAYTFEDTVFQNGVGLNEAYVLDDSANYSIDNQTKEIKKGASLEVEVAYELNDTTTDIEVEVSELFSFSDTTITKTFTIN